MYSSYQKIMQFLERYTFTLIVYFYIPKNIETKYDIWVGCNFLNNYPFSYIVRILRIRISIQDLFRKHNRRTSIHTTCLMHALGPILGYLHIHTTLPRRVLTSRTRCKGSFCTHQVSAVALSTPQCFAPRTTAASSSCFQPPETPSCFRQQP